MDIFNCVDIATAALTIQFQIQDSAELFEGFSGKGKSRDGQSSDSQIAARLYKEDLERNASIVADRQMTISIAIACHTNGQLLTASLLQEQSAASDRDKWRRMGRKYEANTLGFDLPGFWWQCPWSVRFGSRINV